VRARVSASSRTALRVALIVLLAAVTALGAFAVTRSVRTDRRITISVHPPPQVAVAASSTPAPAPTPTTSVPAPTRAGVSSALAASLRASGLGSQVRARVIDAASGAVVLDRDGSASAAPASTAKLLTAAALLALRRPTDRLRTAVRAGPAGSIVLVGAGDPTLTAAPAGAPGRYAGAARLSDLAAQLRARHVRVTKIVLAGGLFAGPTVSPAWAAGDVPSDYGAAITAVMADGGRAGPDDINRSAEPDLAAGRSFARLLGVPTVPVTRGTSAGRGTVLATVSSAPLAELVRQMLRSSDNVIAECLARQVALATHRPATFTGAAAAVAAEMRRLGVEVGSGMVDGSGLAARDRLSPAVLTGVLRVVVRTPRLRDLLDGLPVAGWSGTLVGRYVAGTSRSAVGVVRAKTGTLTGVSALAGLVHDRSGALLAFAVIADRAPNTQAAEAALDDVTGRLAQCGCG
jgi:D-alanyl-D-alanine carboxypeptidase/D-alanyl-D-alanine-endopeptidase (penicillin-binding protein 4)